MQQWYIKEFSKLVGVSVQTLHHYDRIGLLKPSIRRDNGYRLYSETDLWVLQQIVALKFFGFELAQIQTLLMDNVKIHVHFETQAKFLEEKANMLLLASQTLNNLVSDLKPDESIPWKDILKLIEVYRMTQQLEHSWVKEIFTPEELKQYASFETELKTNSTAAQQAAFEKTWATLVADMTTNLKNDPNSAIGIAIGKKCMDWLNQVYGKKYAHLRTKKFEKGFAEGKGLEEANLTPELVAWLDKAINAYLRDRIIGILNQVGTGVPDATILKLWNAVLDDMYGEDNARKTELYDIVFADKDISKKAKAWLKAHLQS